MQSVLLQAEVVIEENMRYPENKDFVKKTIENVEIALNVIKIKFSDNTEISLCAEAAVYTNAGIIPGIFIDE